MTTSLLQTRIDDVTEIVLQIAGRDLIGAVYVSLPERPSYQEIVKLRQVAAERDLLVTITGDTMIIRPRRMTPTMEPEPFKHGAASQWLARHFGPLYADLRSMNEGTR